MRAGGHDPLHARRVQGPDVLFGLLLERVLVSHPPRRVAGARLSWPEYGEVHTRLLEQLRGRDGALARALVVGRRAADPEQDVGRLFARLEHMDAEPVRPVGAVRLWLAPRVGGAIDVSQHRRGLGRKARLDHDQVAPQVDDVVDVLDADRAFLLARAARDAVPHDVVGHRVRHKWRWGPAQELIPNRHDQELRRELLAGIESWTHVLAPAAFGAGHRVDHLLPGEVGGRGGPVPDLIVGRFEVDRLQSP